MDKTAIKNFSIWARNKLIADITYKAGLLGVTEEEIKSALPQSTKEAEFYDIGAKEPYKIVGEEISQRKQLVDLIRKKAQELDYREAYRNVIEEVAYTWFNRLIAIRFMEVNDYMPAHVRVLSSEGGRKLEPDLVTTPFDAELDFSSEDIEHIQKLKDANAVNELFKFLFIRQCNALNAYLPKLFEKTSDYTELLLNVSVTDQDGIVYHLVHDIEEKYFKIRTEDDEKRLLDGEISEEDMPEGQIEIIGWMYQYYNTEPKDEAFALLKKNVKITKERIPAATQLFTPDWIVRYMVENSVGRLWLEGHPDDGLKSEWKYYLDEAEQEADVAAQLQEIRKEYQNIKPEEIKVIDPCMGSGHILVYAFDVLMQIYQNYGYSQRDAAKSIVENNIYGLDIDDRAFQLAYFAVMMKARQYNRRILTLGIEPNLCAIQESNGLKADIDMKDFLLSEEHRDTLRYLLDVFQDAKEYGSILEVENRDYVGFLKAWEESSSHTAGNIVMILWYTELNKVVPILTKQAIILSQKYDSVVTNPPYMGSGSMGQKLSIYIKKRYEKYKTDMYSVFISRCSNLITKCGYVAMITQHSWMFLTSFEKLRYEFLQKQLVNMIHLGAHAFEEITGEVVQTVSFVYNNTHSENYRSKFYRLVNINSFVDKERTFLMHNDEYIKSTDQFLEIPSYTIMYWASDNMLNLFKGKTMEDVYDIKSGLSTGDNDIFVHYWYEVDKDKLSVFTQDNKGWVPYNKGGGVRKWYGLNYYVVNWGNNGDVIRKCGKAVFRNQTYYFREGITWSGIASTGGTFRYCSAGFLFDSNKGPMIFEKFENIYLAMAMLNSKVSQKMLSMLNPTLSLQIGDISMIPFAEMKEETKNKIISYATQNVELSKAEWDSYETSWDYKRSPLTTYKISKIEEAYQLWIKEADDRYEKVQNNERLLNEIFSKEYGLNESETNQSKDSNITIRIAERKQDIKNLISYSVGCMLGRYSLDQDGIVCAGKEFTEENYITYKADMDNIIPITDEEYFQDDIVGLFCEWIKIVYGETTLEENLDYIADSIGTKGNTSRERIRNYFCKDFFVDHCKMYQKAPIYWLFDAGKQNGFKALIYMHRYNADTIGNLRVDYLHRMERIYESEMNRMQDIMDNNALAREVTAASKRKEKLQKQLKECREYDEKIGHLALSRIEIDLDDGVKVNYEKIQTANDGKKYQVLAKI